jgi:hypothetical protein
VLGLRLIIFIFSFSFSFKVKNILGYPVMIFKLLNDLLSFPFNCCNPLNKALEKSPNNSSEVSSTPSDKPAANKEGIPAFNNPSPSSIDALLPRPTANSP